MQQNSHTLTLPEFLDAVADEQRSQGFDINAGAYRDRAIEAAQLIHRNQQLEAQLQDAKDKLAGIARAVKLVA